MSSEPLPKGQDEKARSNLEVTILLVAIFLLALYILFRYNGLWGENDTAVFSSVIDSTIKSGKLLPDKNFYANGYGYPVLAAFIVQVSGLSVKDLQLYASNLFVLWMVIPAWLLFREFTGSHRGATLATIILFVEPEFLFPIFRGTHEKFSRGLMLLCLYLLMRSIRSRNRIGQFVGFMLSFYLAAYALITFNNLISTSFIMSIALALGLAFIVGRISKRKTDAARPPLERLLIVLGSLMALAFLFTFYAYPPAANQLIFMRGVGNQVASIFLPVESAHTNPYTVVNSGWVSIEVYFLVSLANWILLVASVAVWLKQGYDWWVRGRYPDQQNEILLWAFYGAFSFMGAASIIVDVSGAIAANLQHRMFPSFAMVASPLAAKWVIDYLAKVNVKKAVVFQAAVGITILFLAVLSVFKATNEPTLSNYWVFYSPSEMRSLKWAVDNSKSSTIWTDFTERLNTSYSIVYGETANNNVLEAFNWKSADSVFVYSNIIQLRSERLANPLPIKTDSLRIYDDGEATIYRRRPESPYQK